MSAINRPAQLALFPFKSIFWLFWHVWEGLREWWYLNVAWFRVLTFKPGNTISLEELWLELDGKVEAPRIGDTVTFWTDLSAIVTESQLWDDGIWRYTVQVCTFPSVRYLRPSEIDTIVRAKQQ